MRQNAPMRMMRMMKTDFPCECGHSPKDHTWYNADGPHINSCINSYTDKSGCNCAMYEPDNLRYLESLVE